MTAPSDLVGSPRLAGSALLRAVFRRHAAGVAVITVPGKGGPRGFTATSLTSVSAEPALLSFGVGVASSTWPALAEADHVGVHLLAEGQRELAATFARGGVDRFAPPTAWHVGAEGVPVLEGVLAAVVCRVVGRVPAGDHRIVVAELVSAEPVAGDTDGLAGPLVYHQGRFTGLRDRPERTAR
ncbi:flavin reductase family protein [Streptomyces sp. HSG2]|uniref:flavin reductase family protein n=1 Tax=Streptomyces sp. HSG2 TaxID=2797167 RepID=UPI001905503A|nr:flavin reductase family protein [Streptomyces sp. HSG2]